MFPRQLQNTILEKNGTGKAIIIVGPRQVGKTTLIKNFLKDQNFLFFDGDDPITRDLLNSPNTQTLKRLIGHHKIVFIDEAQRISGIGLTLKIIIDQFPSIQLFISGSSSFDLSNKTSEPLTGRKWEYELYPLSWFEYEAHLGYIKAQQNLENRILYGFYPDIINNDGAEKEVLSQLYNSYLFRDILAFANIRKPEVLESLLKALAFQIGSEVSYSELAQTVGVDKNTISKYIQILEQGFIIFKLGSFSRNLRNELKFRKKIYFWDTGIRNMAIANFSNLENRMDKGALWENFLIVERLKQNKYSKSYAQSYFWRTKNQQEIDYIEQIDGNISAFEFKWKNKRGKVPKSFLEKYNASGKIIDKSNFRDFINL